MKSDTERRIFHNEDLHEKKDRLHVHLSKELRSKLKSPKRAILIHKGDKVLILRGINRGKEAKISRVNVNKRKVYLEGITVTNTRGKEIGIPIDPSNLLIMGLESTVERKALFSEDVFKKESPKVEKAVETSVPAVPLKESAQASAKESVKVHAAGSAAKTPLKTK